MFKLNKNIKILEFSLALILVLAGVILRLLPHEPNFTPILTIALFGGVYFSRRVGLVLPLVAMVISDIFIGYYDATLMAFVYASFLLCVILCFWLKKHKKWYAILGSSVLGAVLFFAITNFAVWAFTSWYPKTMPGLVECYVMGLPFFKNTLLSSLFYSIVFFGAYEAVRAFVRKKISRTEMASVIVDR